MLLSHPAQIQRLIKRLEEHLRGHGLELAKSARATLSRAIEQVLCRASLRQEMPSSLERHFQICIDELVRIGTVERRHRDRKALEHFVLGDLEVRHLIVRCPLFVHAAR
jgi:hypothetical protein